jgi:hypothetical protein
LLPYVLALAGLLAGLGIVFIWKRPRAAG